MRDRVPRMYLTRTRDTFRDPFSVGGGRARGLRRGAVIHGGTRSMSTKFSRELFRLLQVAGGAALVTACVSTPNADERELAVRGFKAIVENRTLRIDGQSESSRLALRGQAGGLLDVDVGDDG